MINLEEHKVYIESHKMEMVPLSIAIQALEELSEKLENYNEQLIIAMENVRESVDNLDFND